MTDKNEMITIRLSADNRRKIWQQIKEAMRDNTGCLDFACLDTGFKVPKGWPFGKSEITLAHCPSKKVEVPNRDNESEY